MLMPVKIIENHVMTPDFNSPDGVLHRWPDASALPPLWWIDLKIGQATLLCVSGRSPRRIASHGPQMPRPSWRSSFQHFDGRPASRPTVPAGRSAYTSAAVPGSEARHEPRRSRTPAITTFH